MTHVCKPFIDAILREGPGTAAAGCRLNQAWLGWGLALAAVVAGYVGYGWRGVLLAASVVAFWLLLQFSRALRVMRAAAGRPVGTVDSAVMLHVRLHEGLTLAQILKHTHSLGQRRADEPESYAWRDAGGDEVVVLLRQGRLASWQLLRAAAPGADGAA